MSSDVEVEKSSLHTLCVNDTYDREEIGEERRKIKFYPNLFIYGT